MSDFYLDFDVFEDDTAIIKKIENAKKRITHNFKLAIHDLAVEGVEIVEKNAKMIVKGFEQEGALQNVLLKERETKYSISYIIKNITQDGTYAEFGTGIVGKYNVYKNNALQWEYDVNNHGGKGWYFSRKKHNNQMEWVSKRKNNTFHTFGIASQPFYFISGEEISTKALEFLKNKMIERW